MVASYTPRTLPMVASYTPRTVLDVRLKSEADGHVVEVARHLLDHALDATLRDDRFDDTWVDAAMAPDRTFHAAIAVGDQHPVGYLGGHVERGRLQLDALVSPHSAGNPTSCSTPCCRPCRPPWSTTTASRASRCGASRPTIGTAASSNGTASALRTLLQMRCSLPIDVEPLATRGFVPASTTHELLAVNNRAFLGHPDQGGWTIDTLRRRMAEPWFDPDGVRIHEHDGAVVGFCWTKVHDDPALGEIFAIGVDPAHHGKRLGLPMTAAGLHWLHGVGLEVGMLYVESDNVPAVRTYERLGFETVRVDRAWVR